MKKEGDRNGPKTTPASSYNICLTQHVTLFSVTGHTRHAPHTLEKPLTVSVLPHMSGSAAKL
jgi:hypothetical protein